MSVSALIVSVFLFTCFLTSVDSTDSTEKTVKPGEDVLLHCQGPRDDTIIMLRWSKPDLKSKLYVFYFKDNRSYEKYQHPSFHGRVELRDPEMKNGDASVILKNVNINDAGRYKCYVGKTGSPPELISNITLKVESVITYLTLIPHTCFYSAGNTGGHREEGGDKKGGETDQQEDSTKELNSWKQLSAST
ncbi:coxsackievirus and adenovirus receptor homolog [Lates japonicus]|uniref:Coxsackievirus and adenovirus receptor homolog n=1 Tax=Lates japonicus TaxID=270547 RepID=A0AAD3RJA7_LATJO|nr:coxsackievirus and adenovirus receptor homolog [Lates japonicus]